MKGPTIIATEICIEHGGSFIHVLTDPVWVVGSAPPGTETKWTMLLAVVSLGVVDWAVCMIEARRFPD